MHVQKGRLAHAVDGRPWRSSDVVASFHLLDRIQYSIHDPRTTVSSNNLTRFCPINTSLCRFASSTTIRLLVQAMTIHTLILLLSLFHYGRAQQTLFPPAVPLFVRSPRLSSWQFTPNGSTLGSLWPTTSSHQPNAGQDPSLNAYYFPFIRCNTPTYAIF